MENLPPEIHGLILDSCTFASYKKLRLTSKTLQKLVTPCIFSTIYLGLFDHSIAALNGIADSPHLASIPRKLVICGSWMRALTFTEWKTHVDITAMRYFEKTGEFDLDARLPNHANCRKWTSERIKFGGLSDEQLMVYWKKYYEFAMQQRKWDLMMEYDDVLAQPLAKLTGLRYAVLLSEAPVVSRMRPAALWMNIWTKTLILTGWDPCFHPKDNKTLLHGLLRHLDKRGTTVQLDDVSITLYAPRFWDLLVQHRNTDMRALYRRPFEHVKKLDLILEMAPNSKLNLDVAALEIGHWLARSRVEKLKLCVWEPANQSCRLLRHIPNTGLQHLSELYLAVEDNEEDFSAFLQQHGAKLQTLVIGSVTLQDNDWKRILHELPVWLPNLKSFDVDGPLDSRTSRLSWVKWLGRLFAIPPFYQEYQGYVLRKNDWPTLDADYWIEQQCLALFDRPGPSTSMSAWPESVGGQEQELLPTGAGASSSTAGDSDMSSESSGIYEQDDDQDDDQDDTEDSDESEDSDDSADLDGPILDMDVSDDECSTVDSDWFEEGQIVTAPVHMVTRSASV